jgi:hypothetical protein
MLAALLLAGCVGSGSSTEAVTDSPRDPGTGGVRAEDVDYDGEDCVKIENEQIGQDVTLDVGGIQVSIHSWVSKDGEPGEFRGFSYTSDSGIVFRVKSGGELDYGSTSPWANPHGEGGADVKGVSNVVFCPPPPGGETPDGGTSCTNPDGCGGGTGGGAPDAGTDGCSNPDGCDGGSGGGVPIIP